MAIQGDGKIVLAGYDNTSAENYVARFVAFSERAVIFSIVDVPNDQGGWAYTHFYRSSYDVATEDSLPVVAYNIHRRVDNVVLRTHILDHGK